MIRHQFGQVEFASEHWFRLAATTLASVTGSAGLATAAKPGAARVRRIDLVVLAERMASLVLVLREGTIKQGLLQLDEPVDQAVLDRVAERLNVDLGGRTAAEIESRLAGADGTAVRADRGRPDRWIPTTRSLARRVAERIARTMREFDAATVEEVYSDGLLNVMDAPEFAQSQKLRRVFSALENRSLPRRAPAARRRDRSDPRVHRPGERPRRRCARCRSSSRPTGGPAGPSASSASSVPPGWRTRTPSGPSGFVSGLMNELVDHLYA